MAADKFDVKRFFASPLAVAAVARADDVFGFLARAVKLPPGVSALVTRDTGDLRVCPPGGEVSGEGATEIMFARTEPVELSWVEERITSKDKFQADAHINMRATLAADPGELSSFRTQIMGSNNQATVENLVQYPAPRHASRGGGLRRAAEDGHAGGRPRQSAVDRYIRGRPGRPLLRRRG